MGSLVRHLAWRCLRGGGIGRNIASAAATKPTSSIATMIRKKERQARHYALIRKELKLYYAKRRQLHPFRRLSKIDRLDSSMVSKAPKYKLLCKGGEATDILSCVTNLAVRFQRKIKGG